MDNYQLIEYMYNVICFHWIICGYIYIIRWTTIVLQQQFFLFNEIVRIAIHSEKQYNTIEVTIVKCCR